MAHGRGPVRSGGQEIDSLLERHHLSVSCPISDSTDMPISGCFRFSRGCPRIYKPVCDSDGTTWGNLCTFKISRCLFKRVRKRITLVDKNGPCKPPLPKKLSSEVEEGISASVEDGVSTRGPPLKADDCPSSIDGRRCREGQNGVCMCFRGR